MKEARMVKVLEGIVYKAKRGHVYDRETLESRKYNCYCPADTGDFWLVDCWVCDDQGNIHPGYSVSPVPVRTVNLGQAIHRLW